MESDGVTDAGKLRELDVIAEGMLWELDDVLVIDTVISGQVC